MIVGLLILALASTFAIRHVHPHSSEVSVNALEPGDIIFVDLYDGWCHACYWDHLALYLGTVPGALRYLSPVVVESKFDGGVCYTTLSEFLSRDKHTTTAVARLKESPSRAETVQKAIEYALDQVGKPFDYTATATIPMKLGEARLNCTELIWRSFMAGGVDLDSDGGPLLYPDDIYYSPELEPL